MKSAAAALFLALLISQSMSAEGSEGTVCVAPNSAERPTLFSPGLEYNPATLSLKIDQRQTIPWPHKDSVKIDGLDLKERHLVVLTSDGKRLQSFWFRFSEYKSVDLCIAFDGYGGPELREAKGSPWCKCK
jgi:hypothetical protein